jgi:hypothetical protein
VLILLENLRVFKLLESVKELFIVFKLEQDVFDLFEFEVKDFVDVICDAFERLFVVFF